MKEKMKRKGILFVISAPSGAGKTTLVKKLLNQMPDICFSVSYTTRFPRVKEVDKKDYFFVSKKNFKEMIKQGQFIEYAEVYDNFYGTSIFQIKEQLNQGRDIILDIDTQGAMQIKKSPIPAVLIFILPPSLNELEKRLKKRNTDEKMIIKKRLAKAQKEIDCAKDYDYLVINDKIDSSLKELEAIIIAETAKTKRRKQYLVKFNNK